MIYGPHKSFVDLMNALIGPVFASAVDVELASAIGRPKLEQSEIGKHTEHAMPLLGLKPQPQELCGEYLVLPGPNGTTKRLERTFLYSFATLESILIAAGLHLKVVAEHGPGRVWFLDRPVHYLREFDGLGVRIVATPTGPLYLLRTMYGHEAQAVPR